MDTKKKVLAICGSTRKTSANLQIIRFIAGMAGNAFEMDIYESLAQLPHFNPDMDRENEDVPHEVKIFRNKIAEADGVLICTPEYVFQFAGKFEKRHRVDRINHFVFRKAGGVDHCIRVGAKSP
jgi:chromate reductase